MIKNLLVENQGLIFSVMIFILIFFVVMLLIWLKKIARGGAALSVQGGKAVLGKHLKEDINKIPDLVKENKRIKQQIEDLVKKLRHEVEKRKKDKEDIDKEKEEEKKRVKESLGVLIKKIAFVETNQKGIDSSIETLQSKNEDMREDINHLDSGSVVADGSGSKELKHEIDSLKEEMKANQKQMENWYRLFESIDADMVEINNKLRELEKNPG